MNHLSRLRCEVCGAGSLNLGHGKTLPVKPIPQTWECRKESSSYGILESLPQSQLSLSAVPVDRLLKGYIFYLRLAMHKQRGSRKARGAVSAAGYHGAIFRCTGDTERSFRNIMQSALASKRVINTSRLLICPTTTFYLGLFVCSRMAFVCVERVGPNPDKYCNGSDALGV